MAGFFETLGRRMGAPGPNAKIIEFLQTHPVTSARVAEAKARAAAFPVIRPIDSVSYSLVRERLRVMAVPVGQSAEAYYGDVAALGAVAPDYRRYGQALALMQDRQWAGAVPILQDLVDRHADVIDYHTALGQALLGAGETAASQAGLQRAMELFPRNVPVTVRYAETLMAAGNAQLAHAVLLDLFNVVNPTQAQMRQIALAANAAGETAEAYYYTAESYVQNGDLLLAINTLRIALSTPGITPLQRSRFKARIDELKEYLPARAQAAVERGDPLPEPRQPGQGRQ
jgi:beta-barrel assembly-enhancing protease